MGSGGAELLIGLTYNGTTGRLAVEVVRAAALSSAATPQRPPDVGVKLLLLSHTGQELGRAKTGVKKNNAAPAFMETFVFQVSIRTL